MAILQNMAINFSQTEPANQQTKQDRYLEGRENLARFFNLLEKVDRRINPHLYQEESKEKNNDR